MSKSLFPLRHRSEFNIQIMTNREIVKNWFAHIDAKNLEGLKSLMASNHAYHNPMSPEPIGADEHIGMVQMLTSALDGEHFLDQIIEDENQVVVRGHWEGKHIGEFNGVPASGNQVQFTWIDIFEIENGKVTNEYLELNPMSIMEQLGAQSA
jgi:steroid delta-isomerase-like uncharacterized protein